EYRGIFINDEEELENWVQAHMGEETIGVNTYERIFELLLRLKANYIWPAMHVNSFNVKRENGELADRMGIVVGTSHCDILMRSNNREWYPWLESNGYQDVEYDYSIEGRNREILDEYWDNSIKQNRDFEVCYTLGMRGIHDWGCSMRTVDANPDLTPEQKKKAKVDMLSFIINRQRELLVSNGVGDSMQIFIPYKEVLDMYDNGLKVPEDVTLVWANDNFGYMRRFPSEAEQAREGGNGVYYHVSYWAWPAMDYLFIGSTPLAHIKNEMRKCYDNGIRKLWVLNVGAMKPLEQEMEFFIRYAWEIDKAGKCGSTDDVIGYLAGWITRNFSITDGTETAYILNDFAQLTNVRKVEHMSYDIFAQYAYGDEGARRINKYADLYNRANRIYGSLPENEKDAFYQLVLMKIHAAYYINLDYYYADRSYLCHLDGKLSAANHYTELSRKADYYKREMIEHYNKKAANGKWDRILTPELYKPPVTAMFPPRTPSLERGEDRLGVVLWDHAQEICLDRYSMNPKWIELYNPGEGEIEYEIKAGEGIFVSESAGESVYKAETGERLNGHKSVGRFKYEKRIFIDAIDYQGSKTGITIRNISDDSCITVSVYVSDFELPEDFEGYVEADGYISMPADGYMSESDCGNNAACVGTLDVEKGISQASDTGTGDPEWKIIRYMGRGEGNAVEADASRDRTGKCHADSGADLGEEVLSESGSLRYSFFLRQAGTFSGEIFRFPTLNSVGRIRAAMRVDGGEDIIVESISNDEWRGTWKQNVMSNVDRLTFELPYLAEGAHVLEISAIDRYFTFSGIVIYTQEKKPCYLAPRASYYAGSKSNSK
ncbi:MAG: glycosyl hydrolase 115 family protein, partial [Clostridiales bacterium]|nr:glycosyl hydrolase 115 family protein [Clostridiales bacterium]